MVCQLSLIGPMWLFKYITFGLNCMFILLLFRLIFVYVCLNTLCARMFLFVQELVSWSNSAYVVLTWIHIVYLLGFFKFRHPLFWLFFFFNSGGLLIFVVLTMIDDDDNDEEGDDERRPRQHGWWWRWWRWTSTTTPWMVMEMLTMNVDHDTMDDDREGDDEHRPRHHGWWWRWWRWGRISSW